MKRTLPNSLSKLFSVVVLASAFFFSENLYGQNSPYKVWDKTLGGNTNDDFRDLIVTSDGGILAAGNSYSGQNGDKSQPSKGDSDYWIVKTDSAGNKLWDKSYGGAGREILWSVQQTLDGGFILAGTSASGKGLDKSDADKGFWIVKTDAAGNKIWDKTFAGGFDYPEIIQTADGGYFLGGISGAGVSVHKSEPSRGYSDYWAIRLDQNGNGLWDKTIGGNKLEELHSVLQTNDGGFILGGSSDSDISGEKSEPSRGFKDYWIVKLNASGSKVWDVTLGGNQPDILYTIKQTSDGGLIAGGQGLSTKSGDRSEATRGSSDYWAVRLDANGNKLWDKAFGGSNLDDMFTVQQVSDGGFVFGGRSISGVSEDKSQPCKGMGTEDFWVIKTDANGVKQWDITLGGSGTDTPLASALTTDGGIVLGGITLSPVSGDKSTPAIGSIDYWLVKLKGLNNQEGKPEEPKTITNPSLSQNQPNPFNKTTTISFDLPNPELVELVIYNNQGNVLAKYQKDFDAGNHKIKWEEVIGGKTFQPGIYFYQLSTNSFQDNKRLILLK